MKCQRPYVIRMTQAGPPRALIIGAGIGGLAAAIALEQAGYQPVVFERAGSLRESGFGLLLAANAVRASLARVDLERV